MADDANIKQPTPHEYPYGQFRNVPSTKGVRPFSDTFIGPRDKAYADFKARDRVRLRGTDGFYYVKLDASRRVDAPDGNPAGIAPGPEVDPLLRRSHAGDALYGEAAIVGHRLDSIHRKIQPDWAMDKPILVRGIAFEVEHEYSATDRGGKYVRSLKFDLTRASCQNEWGIAPIPGDLIRIPSLFASEPGQGYFDVKDVDVDETRLGSTGFFVCYRLSLLRSSRYPPERKLPPEKTATDPDIIRAQDRKNPPPNGPLPFPSTPRVNPYGLIPVPPPPEQKQPPAQPHLDFPRHPAPPYNEKSTKLPDGNDIVDIEERKRRLGRQ